jgi:hypothetical protein
MDSQGKKYLDLLESVLELEPENETDIATRLKNIYMRIDDYIENTRDLFEEFLISENSPNSDEELEETSSETEDI